MIQKHSIYVTVPCYNEETQVGKVIETMPSFVDKIVIVDDVSKDRTVEVVKEIAEKNSRVVLIEHQSNGGVGKAIATGYIYCRDAGADVTVVMAGDAQMDPEDLESVVKPVVSGQVDYCKGNRFKYLDGLKKIPPVRKFGNFVLSALTKIASGYWHVTDSQTGYTAISLSALKTLDLEGIYPRYGVPNDILVKLNVANKRVGEVPVNPLYGVGEQSKLRPTRVLFPILWLLFRLWVYRVGQRYVVQNGHPVVGVIAMALLAVVLTVVCFIYVMVVTLKEGQVPKVALIIGGFAFMSSMQFLLSAMHMDYEYNEELCVLLD